MTQTPCFPVWRARFAPRPGRTLPAVYAADLVPLRPGRHEPRAVKRRPKSYPHLNRPRRTQPKLLKRGTVSLGAGALIGGFVVVGNSPKTLLIRGIGPTLTRFGLVGALADPVLTIYDGGEALATNAGWANSAAIATAATEAGAFALTTGSRDAALLVTLKPGSYTAQVKASQVTSSGVALIEIYEVP